MRIAVVGAYGNGKTTLTTALAPLLEIPRVHGTPMADPAGSAPKPLEDCAEGELLQLMLRRFTERTVSEERNPDGFVSDGSSLHEWIYTKVRLALGRHPRPPQDLPLYDDGPYEEVAGQLGTVIQQRVREAYDVFLHVPVEFPLQPGESPISERFRHLSDRLLIEVLGRLGCPVHVVRGSVAERLCTALSVLGAG
ncbi:AAA family ATPase [Amycolatopsis japonica]|uniref:AAA family ATPase n=1 Tax=Amycolatopsis japonica TaxID=208439 RepID=UPI00382A9FCA